MPISCLSRTSSRDARARIQQVATKSLDQPGPAHQQLKRVLIRLLQRVMCRECHDYCAEDPDTTRTVLVPDRYS